jgi:uncharacterized protein
MKVASQSYVASMKLVLIVSLGLITLSGCATNSIFQPYPRQVQQVKDYLYVQDFDKACGYLSPKIEGQDSLLYLQERGRIYQLAGELKKSQADFEKASQIIEDRRFETSWKGLGAGVSSVFLNDNTFPYQGWAYEKVFLHTYQILNYLSHRDLEGALVEVRRANNEQRYELDRRALSKAILEAEAKQYKVDLEAEPESLKDVYKEIDLAVGTVKKSYQNAYTDYLSGLSYELGGDRENARVSYKKALALYPKNRYLQGALERTLQSPKRTQNARGRLVVLYEEGFIPEREELKVPLPYHGRIYTITLPYLKAQSSAQAMPLSIQLGHRNYATEELCRPYALAALALKEEYPSMLLRQLIRLIVRDQSQKQAQKLDEKQGLGGFLSLGTALLGVAIDHADRRSWSTLPNSLQIAEMYLDAGSYPLIFSTYGASPLSLNVELEPNSLCLVYLVKIGEHLEARLVW